MSESQLPFSRVDELPTSLTGPMVLVRLIDAAGFRLYWATEGLTDADYAFQPQPNVQSPGQLLRHIGALIGGMCKALDVPRPDTQPSDEMQTLRRQTLELLHQLRSKVATMSDSAMADCVIRDQPIWYLINGPLADMLTHIGQINTLRRLAGHPLPQPANVFLMQPPTPLGHRPC